jgi:hypothetical protein
MCLISLDELLEKINALPRHRSSSDIRELHAGNGDILLKAKDIEAMLTKLTVYKMEE